MSKLSQEEKIQQTYYNSIASEYDQHYGSVYAVKYRCLIFDNFLSKIGLDIKGVNVLDAMCGGGQNGIYFREKGGIVTGLDLSQEQCAMYEKRFPNSKAVCGSIFATDLPENSFDIIFIDSLHHLHPNISKAVVELHRILKPGGFLIAWEPSSGSILDLVRKVWYSTDPKYFEEGEASVDPKKHILASHPGFAVERVQYGGNFAYVFVFLSMAMRIPLNWVGKYANALYPVEFFIQKLQFKFLSLWFLAAFKKS